MKEKESPYELIGKRFTKLLVVEVLPTYKSGKNYKRKVRCKCDCGGQIDTRPELLKNGRSKSCGCLSRQRLHEGRFKHGLYLHPLYKIWVGIKQRCYNVDSSEYHNYGAKGVVMCDKWVNNPEVFIRWGIENGWEKGLQVDKDIIPMKLGIQPMMYSPEMCCFVTPEVNSNNRSITIFIEYNGERLSISDWAKRTGLSRDRIDDRYRKGWPPEKIFSKTNFNLETRFKNKTI